MLVVPRALYNALSADFPLSIMAIMDSLVARAEQARGAALVPNARSRAPCMIRIAPMCGVWALQTCRDSMWAHVLCTLLDPAPSYAFLCNPHCRRFSKSCQAGVQRQWRASHCFAAWNFSLRAKR